LKIGTCVTYWGKPAGTDADHSPLSSAEVRNEWNYTSTSPAPSRNAGTELPFTRRGSGCDLWHSAAPPRHAAMMPAAAPD